MEYVFGAGAGLLGIVGSIAYIRDTYVRRALPHRIAWSIFLILSIVSLASQAALGASASLIYAGWFVINNAIIVCLSFRKGAGMGGATLVNMLSLALALAGVVLWKSLDSPLLALCAVLISSTIGAMLVLVKSYVHPHSETVTMWALCVVGSFFTMLSVGTLDFALLASPFIEGILSAMIVLAIVLGTRKARS